MPEGMDVFNQDAFGLVSMTDAINALPYVPGRIGELGLFDEQGIPTTFATVEMRNGLLTLIPTSQRGGPAPQAAQGGRTVRVFAVPHITLEDTILAESVQNVRKFGTSDQLEAVSEVVNTRLEELRQAHEVTHEYHRIGAVKGQILDADGATVIYDLFNEFGVAQTTVNFNLADPTSEVRLRCLDVKRAIEAAVGGGVPIGETRAVCGATWFGQLVSHPEVKDAYHRFRDSENNRNDPRKGFEFGGIIFEEYTGTVSGVPFVAANRAHFYPAGVPKLFRRFNAPADFMETANTIGLPIYAKQERMEFDRGVRLHTQSNPLHICTRPGALILGT